MSEISEQQKQKFKELADKKQQIIEQFLSINYRLDTFRTSLNLLISNIYSNKHLKTIPDFDYQTASKLVNDLGALLIGAKNDYQFKNFGLKSEPVEPVASDSKGEQQNEEKK